MTDKYLKINISSLDKNVIEILNAQILNQLEIDGIEENESGLVVYAVKEKFDTNLFKNLIDANNVNYFISELYDKNWNAEWEKNYDPVVVEDFVAILADFHSRNRGTVHEILITPKMSFGTGHHATTFMMVSMMRLFDLNSMQVVDFGTGTGVLAILAEKMGASRVQAIDCDDWSIENASENIDRNSCKTIRLIKADQFEAEEKVDLILANINRNVIIDNLEQLADGLKPGGIVIFSGILSTDLAEIEQLCMVKKLLKLNALEKNNWVCVAFKKG